MIFETASRPFRGRDDVRRANPPVLVGVYQVERFGIEVDAACRTCQRDPEFLVELIQRHQATILLDELNATHAQLQTYVDQVEELTVARERNRMAREIHDTLGHYLTVINVQIESEPVAVKGE